MKAHETDNLTPDQVEELLAPVTDGKAVDQLYSFGSMLLNDVAESRARVESKAINMLTWSIAIVAFIFTQIDIGKVTLRSSCGSFAIAIVLAMVAMGFSWMAIRARKRAVPGDVQWFPADILKGTPEKLKLHHVRILHIAKSDLVGFANRKSTWLFIAQTCLASSGLSLATGVILHLWLS